MFDLDPEDVMQNVIMGRELMRPRPGRCLASPAIRTMDELLRPYSSVDEFGELVLRSIDDPEWRASLLKLVH